MSVLSLVSELDLDCAEKCIALGRYEDAKELLKSIITEFPLNPTPYIKLLGINALQQDKPYFRFLVGVFVNTFSVKHAAWPEVKVLWNKFNDGVELISPVNNKNIADNTAGDLIPSRSEPVASSATSNESRKQRSPVRINLLLNVRSNAVVANPAIAEHITLVSETAYRQLCRAKLEERVLGRVRELHGIVAQKQLRLVMPDVLEKVEALRREQSNLSEVADIVTSHLHAQCLLGKPAKLPPLLLVGGPGTGKTRFVNKLAEALGLPFCDISLAGRSDTFTISGLSKYWGSADAGLVATTIHDSDVANPVFLFDEIDKAGFSDHGNPLDALLLLLEEESSKHFKDDFIGLPMDLSYSSVLATANSIENLPEPLLSRFVVVQVPELDHDGRIIMARLVYAELLHKHGYDAMFNTVMDDNAAKALAYLPLKGREFKRAVETSMLSALSEVDVNDCTKDKLSLELHHIPEIDAKVETTRIGFMR